MANVDVSVVVPVYNSEATLRALAERTFAVLDARGLRGEMVFVEDGGADGSWDVLRAIRDERPGRVTIVQLMRNYGQHNALMCGFRRAQGDVIVTIDDDLQNPPEEIPRLLDALRTRDLDLVYGLYESKRHASWRNAGSKLVNVFYRAVFGNDVTVASFRAMRRPLLEAILEYDLNYTFVDGLLAWNTRRIGQTPVAHEPRREGRSGYDVRKLLVLALNLFTNFSLVPLQVVSACGLLVSAVGFALALYYLGCALASEIVVPGYASTIIAILMIGGTQLLGLGIIGEYLGRLHLNVNRKPQYRVREESGVDAGAGPAGRSVRLDRGHATDARAHAPATERSHVD